jgi:hypothetical protein
VKYALDASNKDGVCDEIEQDWAHEPAAMVAKSYAISGEHLILYEEHRLSNTRSVKPSQSQQPHKEVARQKHGK